MKPTTHKKAPSTVTVGNIYDIPGSVNIAGGDIRTEEKTSIHYDASAEIVAKALASALEKNKKRSKTTRARKTEIEKEVAEINSELRKKKVDKGFLTERFRNIAKMAPDILEVIIAGLGNPVTGLALTMKKIAEKAKAEERTEAPAK